ncbi:MAG: class II glutamine amidotransferase [Deltaproteobacteria bacterium]|nr:class II glutamine amidotransferase [Deltaproteobacteria bacterium]
MCRALAYLGQPVLLDHLLYGPDNSLVKQTYMPKMLRMLNLAGFGLNAWDLTSYDPETPFSYVSTALPIFDRNLKGLARKIKANCVLAHVRGVAYSPEVEIAPQNVHPFHFPGTKLWMAHNGDLARFREMKPFLAEHLHPQIAQFISGSTDSEWIYALLLSQLGNPMAYPEGGELQQAIERVLGLIRQVRERCGITTSSFVNLFITTGIEIVAVRYCFDFGCYATEIDALHELNFSFLSLWYTCGAEYGLHDGEWKMIGGSKTADSIMIASEPLTRDTTAWIEVPEYSLLYADMRKSHRTVETHYLEH